jgi:hypothetical protein
MANTVVASQTRPFHLKDLLKNKKEIRIRNHQPVTIALKVPAPLLLLPALIIFLLKLPALLLLLKPADRLCLKQAQLPINRCSSSSRVVSIVVVERRVLARAGVRVIAGAGNAVRIRAVAVAVVATTAEDRLFHIANTN